MKKNEVLLDEQYYPDYSSILSTGKKQVILKILRQIAKGKNHLLEDALEIEKYAKLQLSYLQSFVPLCYYNMHQTPHSENILFYFYHLIGGDNPVIMLTPEEYFIFYAAAWLHDIGMFPIDEKLQKSTSFKIFKETTRKKHGYHSAARLMEKLPSFVKNIQCIDIIAYMSARHTSLQYPPKIKNTEISDKLNLLLKNNVEDEDSNFEINGYKKNRIKLLTLLLEFSDELDLSIERMPTEEMITKFKNSHGFKNLIFNWNHYSACECVSQVVIEPVISCRKIKISIFYNKNPRNELFKLPKRKAPRWKAYFSALPEIFDPDKKIAKKKSDKIERWQKLIDSFHDDKDVKISYEVYKKFDFFEKLIFKPKNKGEKL